MNIKKKNFILIIMLTIAGTLLFTCGIFAVVSKSVSFNLALKLDPQIYFSLSMRIDYDGDGNYTGTHPSDAEISESTQYTIFNNSANATGLVNWATVNQNCIVLNQVLAGNILGNLTVNSRFEITVTNLTQSNEVEYLNLTLNYNGAEEVFKADNGYGAVNMKYDSTDEETKGTKTFTLIPQTTLLDGYIQIPFKAEIDTELRYTVTLTTTNCDVVSCPSIFSTGESIIAHFEATKLKKPLYNYTITYGNNIFNDTQHSDILRISPDVTTNNILVNVYAYEYKDVWNGVFPEASANAAYSGGNGSASAPFLISTGRDLAWLSENTRNIKNYTSGKHFLMTNDIYLNDETFTDLENNFIEVTDGTNLAYISTDIDVEPTTAGDFYSDMETVYATQPTLVNNQHAYGTTGKINHWSPIGTTTDGYYFYGVFDGGNFEINGMYINGALSNQGLFCRNSGTIQNVGAVNGTMIIKSNAGGIGVVNYSSGTISNCWNEVTIVSNLEKSDTTRRYISGIFSRSYSLIQKCINYANLKGGCYIAGVCGWVTSDVIYCANYGNIYVNAFDEFLYNSIGGIAHDNYGFIRYCTNFGKVTSTAEATYVGGICAFNGASSGKGTLQNCYNYGMVSGYSRVGGIAGTNFHADSNLSNCYNLGTITGTSNVGSICGHNNGTLSNNYYLTGSCSKGNGSATDSEGTVEALATKEAIISSMQSVWDFKNVWGFSWQSDYPVLRCFYPDAVEKLYN